MKLRLAHLAPELTEQVLEASPEARRRAVVAACALALVRSSLDEPRATDAMRILRNQAPASPTLRDEVETLTEELDRIQWQIQEELDPETGSDERHRPAFLKARASAALWFALGHSTDDELESIYEAIAAVEDFDEVRSVVLAEVAR